jgi:two-component system sensor histidine kinase HydH
MTTAEFDPTSLPLHLLPTAAVVVHDGIIRHVNRAYEELMGFRAADVVGQAVSTLVDRDVSQIDLGFVRRHSAAAATGQVRESAFVIRTRDGNGRLRALRVEWRLLPAPGWNVTFLVDEEQDPRFKEIAEALARVGATLAGASDEREVMQRVLTALAAQGFLAVFLLVRPGQTHLALGPLASGIAPENQAVGEEIASNGLDLELLRRLNPAFDEGRAAFFHDFDALVDFAFPKAKADAVKRLDVGGFVVQVPLLLHRVPFGALVVVGDGLSTALSAPLEMLAELTMQAIEAVRLQRELVERERLAALGEAAAVMAHEVRNPVAAMLNAVALLRRGQGDAGELLSLLAEDARRLDRVVSNLLTLGRPISPHLQPLDAHLVARSALDALLARGVGELTNVVIPPTERRYTILADAELAQLALMNILRNAVQSGAEAGAVAIRVSVEPRDEGARVAIVVDDAGPGFGDRDGERLLEPFYTTRATGTGVGLAVVRRVAEACRGRVELGKSPLGGARVALVFEDAVAEGADSPLPA